jgi:rubredoxin
MEMREWRTRLKHKEGAYRVMKRYMCVICGFIYDEAKGLPEDGIEPGTRWEDIPPNWTCPDCGARKEDFEMMEM